MTKESIRVSGQIESVIFQSDVTGWAVLRLLVPEGQLVTVVGFLPFPAPGEQLEAQGNWTRHPRHGEQFRAETMLMRQPADTAAILEYLSSGVVPGIGPAMALRIVEAFGATSLDILAAHPERLAQIPGISANKAKKMGDAFQHMESVRSLMQFLMSHGFPPQLSLPLYRQWGREALAHIEENPYLLLREDFSIAFAAADKLASEMGLQEFDSRRMEAALLYTLSRNVNNGHSYLPYERLLDASSQLLRVPAQALEQAFANLVDKGGICRTSVGRHTACYLPQLYEAEQEVARRLTQLQAEKPDSIPLRMEELEEMLGISYAPMQKQALQMVADRKVVLLTGGPGTGKTTVLRGVATLFAQMGLSFHLAAPTGRAAKRMQELSGQEAQTIHRLLEAQMDDAGQLHFGRDEDAPLEADVVIVDEVSMVDILLMRALVCALGPQCRLVLIGDIDQLPPVGPGRVFADLIETKRLPMVRLTEIFRQASQSRIVLRAHEVNRGDSTHLRDNEGDFFFLERRDEQKALETILDLCGRRLPEKLGLPPDQIQVLSPTRRGLLGTGELNRQLQALVNPAAQGKTELLWGHRLFRVGDRIMQIKNNYDLTWEEEQGSQGQGVFNGDVGHIEHIDLSVQRMRCRFDNHMVEYTFDLLHELEPAYAMTVHKAQGSEYPAVVLALSDTSPMLLSRRVLYTAITRARLWMILVGSHDALLQMVSNKTSQGRFSGLRFWLEQ